MEVDDKIKKLFPYDEEFDNKIVDYVRLMVHCKNNNIAQKKFKEELDLTNQERIMATNYFQKIIKIRYPYDPDFENKIVDYVRHREEARIFDYKTFTSIEMQFDIDNEDFIKAVEYQKKYDKPNSFSSL